MSKELPPGHPMSAHKDEVGQTMHRWKHHDPKPLHSGRGKGGKEGKVVKSQDQAIAIALSMAGKSKKGKGKTSDHAERLMSMGYSEEVAREVADMLDETYDFTTCERPNGSRYGTGGKCRKGTEISSNEQSAIDQLSALLPKGEKILDSARKTHVATGPKMSKNEKIAAEVLSDKQFNSDRKRIAEMIRRGVPKDSDFVGLVADARQKMGGQSTDTIRSLVKKEPTRKSEEDVVNKRGQMIGTSPRNMLIDNINGFKARLKDARSEEERKFLQEVIRKAEQQLQDEGG